MSDSNFAACGRTNLRRLGKVFGLLPITVKPGSPEYHLFVAQLSERALVWLHRAERVFRIADRYALNLAQFESWRREASLNGLLYAERRLAQGFSMGAIHRLTGITRDRLHRFETGSKPLPTRALCAYERVLGGRPPKGARIRLAIEQLTFRGQAKYIQSSLPHAWVTLDVDRKSSMQLHAACRRLNIKTSELLRALFHVCLSD